MVRVTAPSIPTRGQPVLPWVIRYNQHLNGIRMGKVYLLLSKLLYQTQSCGLASLVNLGTVSYTSIPIVPKTEFFAV